MQSVVARRGCIWTYWYSYTYSYSYPYPYSYHAIRNLRLNYEMLCFPPKKLESCINYALPDPDCRGRGMRVYPCIRAAQKVFVLSNYLFARSCLNCCISGLVGWYGFGLAFEGHSCHWQDLPVGGHRLGFPGRTNLKVKSAFECHLAKSEPRKGKENAKCKLKIWLAANFK